MLNIQNIENIKKKEFSFLGDEWILYGIDVSNIEYKFIFIPMEAGRYDISKSQLVILDRNKKRIGNHVLGYRLWTTNGMHTYIDTNQIPDWQGLVEQVWKNKMLYANN